MEYLKSITPQSILEKYNPTKHSQCLTKISVIKMS